MQWKQIASAMALSLVLLPRQCADSRLGHRPGATPAVVLAGSPELIRVEAPASRRIDGEWLGRKIQFFRAHPGATGSPWQAWTSKRRGPSTVESPCDSTGGRTDLSRAVDIHPAHYRTGTAECRAKVCRARP